MYIIWLWCICHTIIVQYTWLWNIYVTVEHLMFDYCTMCRYIEIAAIESLWWLSCTVVVSIFLSFFLLLLFFVLFFFSLLFLIFDCMPHVQFLCSKMTGLLALVCRLETELGSWLWKRFASLSWILSVRLFLVRYLCTLMMAKLWSQLIIPLQVPNNIYVHFPVQHVSGILHALFRRVIFFSHEASLFLAVPSYIDWRILFSFDGIQCNLQLIEVFVQNNHSEAIMCCWLDAKTQLLSKLCSWQDFEIQSQTCSK